MNDELLIWEAYETSMNSNDIVRNAIQNIKEKMSGYWSSTVEQRSAKSDKCAGSRYDMSPEEIEETLLSIDWKPYSNQNINPPAKGFITTQFGGHEGILELKKLPKNTNVRLDDFKKTGKVSAIVDGKLGDKKNFTVILVGPYQDMGDVVWTFHPGEPIAPSVIDAENMDGKVITAEEAVKMGFLYAKVGKV